MGALSEPEHAVLTEYYDWMEENLDIGLDLIGKTTLGDRLLNGKSDFFFSVFFTQFTWGPVPKWPTSGRGRATGPKRRAFRWPTSNWSTPTTRSGCWATRPPSPTRRPSWSSTPTRAKRISSASTRNTTGGSWASTPSSSRPYHPSSRYSYLILIITIIIII